MDRSTLPDNAGRSDPGTTQLAGGPVSDDVDGDEEAGERDEDEEQGPEGEDEGPKKVVLKWRKASDFTTDERKLPVQLAFPDVAGPFEEALVRIMEMETAIQLDIYVLISLLTFERVALEGPTGFLCM